MDLIVNQICRLKDVAWLTRSINYSNVHTFVCKFDRVEGAARKTKLQTNVTEKLEKLTERIPSNLHSSNLVNIIFYFVF